MFQDSGEDGWPISIVNALKAPWFWWGNGPHRQPQRRRVPTPTSQSRIPDVPHFVWEACQTQCRGVCLFCAAVVLASFCATQAADESVCDAIMTGDEATALGDTQADEASCF